MRHNMSYKEYTDKEIGLNKVDKSIYLLWVVAFMVASSIGIMVVVYQMMKSNATVTMEIKKDISQLGGDNSKVYKKVEEVDIHIQDNNLSSSNREYRIMYQNQQSMKNLDTIKKIQIQNQQDIREIKRMLRK